MKWKNNKTPDLVANLPLSTTVSLRRSGKHTYFPTGMINEQCEGKLGSFDLGEREIKSLGKQLKKRSKTFPSALRAYLDLPNAIPSPKAGWLLVALFLMSLVLDIVKQILCCAVTVNVTGGMIPPSYLLTLLDIHTLFPILHVGEKREGKIAQPNLIQAAVQPQAASELLGGFAMVDFDKIHFWLPVINRPFAILPGVNETLRREILESSPFSLPISIGRKIFKNEAASIQIEYADLAEHDQAILATAQENLIPLRGLLALFSCWFHEQRKPQKQINTGIDTFIPVARNGRFSKDLRSDPEALIRATALSVLQVFLKFCSDNGWISEENVERYISDAWASILPESAPTPPAGQCPIPAPSFEMDPEMFWNLLTHYLETGEVKIGEKGSPSTSALINDIGNERYLILPRSKFCNDLRANISNVDKVTNCQKFETWLPTHMRDVWNISVKTESNDISYRYKFYANESDSNKGKAKIPCLAIPWSQLPESIRLLLQPNPSDSDTLHAEQED